jgi:pilus assembly protein Flp/PilA
MKNTFFSVKLQEVVTKIYDLVGFFGGNASIKSQKGVTMIEYSLIAALVGIAAIGSLGTLGDAIDTLFGTVADALN